MDYTEELNQFENYLLKRGSSGTARVYVHALKHWFKSINGNIPSQISAQSYIDKLTEQGKSASTVSLRGNAIIRFFKWKGVKINLDCPTVRIGEPDYLLINQIEKLIEKSDTVLEEVLVIVLFDTAVRINELLSLELDDIYWETKLISVTRKGSREDLVNISDKALEVLSEWIEIRESNDKRVFMDIDYNYVWGLLKRLGRKCGMRVHPHIFRHSRAIHMLMTGSEMYVVQQHLGHTNIATTANIYSKFKAVHLKMKVPTW